MHLDYVVGNICVKKIDKGYDFFLVDLNRLYKGVVTSKTGVKNLKRISRDPEIIKILAEEYANKSSNSFSDFTDYLMKSVNLNLQKLKLKRFAKNIFARDFRIPRSSYAWDYYSNQPHVLNNKKLKRQLGADVGCDSIGDFSQAKNLSKLLGMLNDNNKLTNTIIYNLNPSMNEVFATMSGNFNNDKVEIQWGTAWWFLDQKDGMELQMKTLSNMGLLSKFIGMLTDSRSFLSFPRHEYFRRILCNMLGKDIENGLLPNDLNFFGSMVENICYHNLKEFIKYKK